MAEQRRVRIPHHRANRDAAGEPTHGDGRTEIRVGILDTRQDASRYAEEGAELVAPGLGVNIKQLGARGVARVRGVDFSSRQVIEQPGVDGSGAQSRPLPRARAPPDRRLAASRSWPQGTADQARGLCVATTRSSISRLRSASMRSDERRHCQVTQGPIVSPVERRQSRTVSR